MAWLGLDCGGTRSRWSWRPESFAGAGEGPSVQPVVQGVANAATTLAAVVATARTGKAANEPRAIVAALAGAGDAAIRAEMAGAVRGHGVAVPFAVVTDVLAAAAGALGDGPGVLIWSGTGSFAVARGRDGTLHRAGGRGYLLGDQGSAYDLVRRAAAQAVLASDGLAEATTLGDALARAFSAPTPARLGAVLQRLEPGAVAKQLGVVLDCAARGDVAAQLVLDEGIDALAMVAAAAVRAAGDPWADAHVFLGGGAFVAAPVLVDLMTARIRALAGCAPRLVAADTGARGAASLAQAMDERSEPLCRWVDDGSI